MGQWLASFLKNEGLEVIITGRNREKLAAAGKKLGVETATNISAVKNADIIILSVSIDNFKKITAQIYPYVKPEQIIIDITSIKQTPVDIMHKYFASSTVLGTHPLFGPGAKGISGQKFILTPTNKKELLLAEKIKQYLQNRKACVYRMTPTEHDNAMSVILGLSHFIGLVTADTLSGMNNLKEISSVSGTTYKLIKTLAESVASEDPELYSTLQMSLPGLTNIEREFQQKAGLWADLVEAKDKAGFMRRMNSVRKKLEKNSPDFGKSYADMYKLIKNLD